MDTSEDTPLVREYLDGFGEVARLLTSDQDVPDSLWAELRGCVGGDDACGAPMRGPAQRGAGQVSDELSALVAATADPATVDELLREAMARLRAEYPAANLHSVQVTFSACDRTDLGLGRRHEQDIRWSVQANNEHGHGSSSREAFAHLAEDMAAKALVPSVAARVADALRGVADEGFAREDVIGEARKILAEERRNGR